MLRMLLIVLLILYSLGYLDIWNTSFLRVGVIRSGGHTMTVLDALIVIVVLLVMIAVPGPLAVAFGALLMLWIASTFGVVVIPGVPLAAVLILVLATGLLIHILTRRTA